MDVGRPIDLVVAGFEALGVLVLVVGTVLALIKYVMTIMQRRAGPKAYQALRQDLGRVILLGLELLVAADIIRSVALDPTLESIATLGLLVLIRTFLSWALEVEIEGEWPWRRSRQESPSR